jgi:S1-C subfamily serine protease
LLKVLKLGEKFIFSINGNVIENVDSKILRGNYFGILAGGKGEYILENITLKEFVTISDIASNSIPSKEGDTDSWKGNGSGFFINEKGYIATNYHVIEDAKDIQIEYFQKGIKQIYKAKVIVSDKQNDLAILKIDDVNLRTLPRIPYVFNTSIKDVGTEVFALGYPIANVMGEEVKFTDGKISSKTGLQGDVRVYQISAPIQPGNSGGPLFDTKGNLVGITSSALNKEYFNSENVNYAIKSTYLKNLIDVLPETISIPDDIEIYSKTLTEKIKILSDYVPIIKIR